MDHAPRTRLDRPVEPLRDHILGNGQAEITLVEYGSYACPFCHAVHEVIAELRDHFGTRMRYVFRHRPITGSDDALRSAELSEFAYESTGEFWVAHDVLMKRGPDFGAGELERIASELGLPPREENEEAWRRAERRVQESAEDARRTGARITPTFFINGRKYEGPWDESSLSEAMLGSLGHRLHASALDFARWAPSTGLLLLAMSILAIVLVNSPFGPAFEGLWTMPAGLQAGTGAFVLPLRDWINDGLLTIFFLVVGLEIKREFTIGRLATRRAAALPVAAAIGGMVAPACIYLLLAPPGPLKNGWGIPIATDTAFAVALIAALGSRVPIELRVFLTAAAIVDDLVVILLIAVFYAGDIDVLYLAGSVAVTVLLIALNSWGIYRALPYAVLGIALWACLHGAGVHATLAGVILAIVTPTRPPANLRALMAQANTVLLAERRYADETVMRHGPSEPTLRELDAIHDRIESPASKLLRSIEPWSSYFVLPVFAFANAGVALSATVLESDGALVSAIVFGLVVGKPTGILAAAALAVGLGLAVKPDVYSWRQMAGAGALAGIGFTMSLFIAGQAFPDPTDFAAAKLAIFLASLIAGTLGTLLLLPRRKTSEESPGESS